MCNYNVYVGRKGRRNRLHRRTRSARSRQISISDSGGFSGQRIWTVSLGYSVRRFSMQNVFSRDSLHWITIGYRATISRDFIRLPLLQPLVIACCHIRHASIISYFYILIYLPIFQKDNWNINVVFSVFYNATR